MQRPTLFFLHALGASRDEWRDVIATLEPQFECVALDVPGFGTTPSAGRLDVIALTDWFCAEVADRAPPCWFAIGHSMGGKIATLAAARSRDGLLGLAGLGGVILIAASPPSPEPMDPARRAEMLAWFGSGAPQRQHAETFVDNNAASMLPPALRERAIADVLRSQPEAWAAWLLRGSRQDVADAAGTLHVPALIMAGAEDGDLGADAQRRLNLPHYPAATLECIPGAAHLLPYEAPHDVARLITLQVEHSQARRLPDDFMRLLNSNRVVPRMRSRLLQRHAGPAPDARGVLSDGQRAVLGALAAAVLDGQADGLDLARRIDIALANEEGDGWRFADLPADVAAWKTGLDMLQQMDFGDLPTSGQAALLTAIARGAHPLAPDSAFSTAQLAHWFEDARATVVRTWTSLPSTFALMGYDGFAVGGDGRHSLGYTHTEADHGEDWQLRGARP